MSANIDPIFVKEIFEWNTTLITQVTPRKITTETPVELGSVGEDGGFIHSITLQPLGNIIATVFRLYRQVIVGTTTNYFLVLEQSIPSVSNASAAAGIDSINVILPLIQSGGTGINERRALDCASGSKYYCGLGTAVVAESGINVNVRGGNY